MPVDVRVTSTADDYTPQMKLLVAGAPGSGKTLTSSTFPDPFFCSAEGGLMSLAGRKVKYTKITSIAELLQVKKDLSGPPEYIEKNFRGPVRTVVIDTIDEVGRILQAERLVETKKEIMAMGDWGWYGEQLRSIIRGFRNLDMHVVFTCHLKTAEDGETGTMFIKPAIQGAVGDEIAGMVDLALLLQARTMNEIVDGENRRKIVRYFQTYQDARHPWIKDRSGKLPSEFPINFTDDFDRLNTLIYGGVRDAIQQERNEQKLQVQRLADELAPEPVSLESAHQKTLQERMVEEDAVLEVVPEPIAQPIVPEPETKPSKAAAKAEAPEQEKCAVCSEVVDNEDQILLSRMRFRKVLCREDFVAEKRKKS